MKPKNQNIPEVLFDEIIGEVDYVNASENMLAKLERSIIRGMGRIRRWASDMSLDFSIDEAARELLINYVRYSLDGIVDEFRANYQPDIIALRHRKEAELYAAENQTENLS